MAKRFDIRTLFEKKRSWQRPDYTGFRSIYEELDAVHMGKKAISVEWPLRDWVESQEFIDVIAYAHDRGLMVVLDPNPNEHMPRDRQPMRAFILRTEEMWRIPAIRALESVRCDEGVTSTLFGYSKKQIRRHLEYRYWCRPEGRYGDVYYALLAKDQRDDVIALGHKAFGDPTGLVFFECGLEMKRDAWSRVPKHVTVARFLMTTTLGWKIVGDATKRRLASTVYSNVVPKKLAPQINQELGSPIEFLTRRGWSS
ncbi:MAG: hypothetical protein M4D80_23655 [Myxococcota bacterium]|nr:hypothetical protein [Deltaproteobacteria bacterium]MDQ3338173.1 hypothetical protein [Myxococcota bacterium]